MGDPHRTVGRVDRLAAGSACPEDVDAQILLVNADIDLLRLGQHRNGGRGGVDAPARLGLRYALDAVYAGLELQPSEHAGPADQCRRFLKAAEAGLGQVEEFEAPAAQRSIALIHAKEVGSEQRRLLPPGAGSDLEDGVALVVGILWQ